jgi:transcriptional regulator with XRE-family HTH domain
MKNKSIKLAVAIRTARAAIGWNQQEFADLLDTAKSTIARIETLEVKPSAAFLLNAIDLFKKHGINISFFDETLSITLSEVALLEAETLLLDDNNRRSDRKKNRQ